MTNIVCGDRLGQKEDAWLELPLARLYASLLISRSSSFWIGGRLSFATWCTALLDDGALEVSGPWFSAAAHRPINDRVLRDLQWRGVERVRFELVAEQPTADAQADGFPGAIYLPAMADLTQWSLSQVRGSMRDEVARKLRDVHRPGAHRSVAQALESLDCSSFPPVLQSRWRKAIEMLEPYYAAGVRRQKLVLKCDQLGSGFVRRVAMVLGRRRWFPDEAAARACLSRSWRRSALR